MIHFWVIEGAHKQRHASSNKRTFWSSFKETCIIVFHSIKLKSFTRTIVTYVCFVTIILVYCRPHASSCLYYVRAS